MPSHHPKPTEREIGAFRKDVARWAAKIGVRPKRVQIQRMTAKWASCSTAGRLTFNSDLIREDSGLREFVIVHELLHLLVPNHGRLFRGLLKAYLPRWNPGVGMSASSKHAKR